jgi:hypothetical protein
MGPGHTITSPSDVGNGTYVKKGDKTYRVVHRTATALHLQDVHDGRGVGRPTKIRKSDLEGGDYKIAVTPRSAETGERIKNFSDLRQGQVIRAMHHRDPQWVRVESIGADKIKIQPLDPQTAEPVGEPEELGKTDLKRWAYLTKTGNLPEALLPPLEEPPGGFAEAGSGELTSNLQPGRYDDVRISLSGVSEEQLKQILGPAAEGKNPKHVIADLAGAGGLASSLNSVTISVSTYQGSAEITVTGAGSHIQNMSRYISFRNGRPNYISNSHFRLASTAPKYMGLKMFATQVATARDMGFKHITVSAAGNGPWRDGEYNGYYVWPRFGYDGPFPSYTFDRMPPNVQEQIRQVRPSAPSGLRYLDVMMAGQETRDWFKEHGSSSDLDFPLDSGSRSLEYLTEYVQDIARKSGSIGADQFLNRAAKKKKKDKDGPPYEWYPTFGPEQEEISDAVWDRMGDRIRKKNKKKERKKQATRNLVDLATHNDAFRKLLLTELKKGDA